MRKSRVGSAGIAAALLALGIAAAPAGASVYQLTGNQGTVCTIEVTANATHGINGLELPHVGFAGEPECTYALQSPSPSPGAGTPASAVGGTIKACKKGKKGKKAKKPRRCGKKKKRKRLSARASAAAAARVANPARLEAAVLRLILPLGLFFPGDKSLSYLVDGGYSCTLDQGANCADHGNLTPAIPLIPVYTEYKARFVPPAGESWVGVPSGCSGSGAVTCVLISETVTPQLL